ncbi:transcriptional regulator [Cellulomonas hominis]|uniref:Transcriptional regulator n=1 Tax=Cellulomonas hominis TaxID=156981 RepID=A0A511FA96_9CELL|nr:LacI family DNA-binding transcriptional regulator [Cellulomonas hominis]MBB5472080.1 LacI family transcriptional regulator [Cellulomonas hominis]NKY07843.1 LacI family transcriptional regulator [Cellulomonas hominis]GEL46186.1 transcriptional regulator [Cellulomonas hominis]
MPRGRTTIADIASEVGVSIPTVSKVLNGRTDVAEATRARVEAALERHEYRKPVATRTGGSGVRLLDLVFHEADNLWSQEIIKGVEQVCGPERVGVVLSELGGSHRPPQEWIDDVMARRPLGVLLVLSGLDAKQRHQLSSRNIPFAVVDTQGEPPAGVPTVGSNNWNGGLSGTRHLLALGHRRIAAISGPDDMLCSRARVDGFRSAHDELGVPWDPALIRWGGFDAESGYRHGLDLLRGPDRPTAVFAGSDYQALGVLRAARELGLRVPEELSVVGYDDLPISQWLDPGLTTVHQPLREMASMATRMLLTLAADGLPPSMQVELVTELVIRSSTAPPAAG